MIPKTMKAATYSQYGDPEVLQFGDVPVPILGRGEALVKVDAVGLNGYDLMARSGRYKPNKGRFPHILGGDFGGTLAELGPETSCDLEIGTRVTSWWVLPCERCDQCMGGHPNRCSRNYRYLGAHEHGAYAQMPYEAISSERYEELAKQVKPISFMAIGEESSGEQFCSNDVCAVP